MEIAGKLYPKSLDGKTREEIFGWFLILPALIIILSLILYPIMYNTYLSFFDVNLEENKICIGLDDCNLS